MVCQLRGRLLRAMLLRGRLLRGQLLGGRLLRGWLLWLLGRVTACRRRGCVTHVDARGVPAGRISADRRSGWRFFEHEEWLGARYDPVGTNATRDAEGGAVGSVMSQAAAVDGAEAGTCGREGRSEVWRQRGGRVRGHRARGVRRCHRNL